MSAYVPILATDPSRCDGLAATPDIVKARLTPLLEFTPPPRGGRQGGGSLETHLDVLVEGVARAFGARTALADACDVGSARDGDCARTADGRVHLAYLLDQARARGLTLVPVTGLRRPDAYQLAVADAASVDRRGVALRLQRPDFRDPDVLGVRTLAVLDALGTASEDVDLVLDFGGVTAGHLAAYTATARAVLPVLTRDIAWRSVTIAAATQLLADGRGLTRGPRAVPRTDWLLWRALTTGVGTVPTLECYARTGTLRFGDYGPLLYGPHPVRPGGAAEWVGYAHGAEWVVRDVVGEATRAVAIPVVVPDAPRPTRSAPTRSGRTRSAPIHRGSTARGATCGGARCGSSERRSSLGPMWSVARHGRVVAPTPFGRRRVKRRPSCGAARPSGRRGGRLP